jgi:hypothetical protein
MGRHLCCAQDFDACRFLDGVMPPPHRLSTGDGNVDPTCESAVALVRQR